MDRVLTVTTTSIIVLSVGVISLVLWAGVILSGRFIAYSWFDCDHQPQSALVNAFAGCVVETDPPAR